MIVVVEILLLLLAVFWFITWTSQIWISFPWHLYAITLSLIAWSFLAFFIKFIDAYLPVVLL